MAGVNKVILVGNLGKDPEIRSMQNGGRVASFSLATSETWKDKASGERKEKTEWHRIAVFNDNLVSLVERYVKKGSKIYVEGQLETRKWTDQGGQERYTTEVVIKQFRGDITLLDGRGDGGGGGQDRDGGGYDRGGGGGYDRGGADRGGSERGGSERGGRDSGSGPAASRSGPPQHDLDDDIPF